MSDLNVSLVLKLKNLLGKGVGEARRDLSGLKTEAGKLGGTSGAEKLAAGVAKVDVAATAAKRDIMDLRRQADALKGSPGAEKLAADLRRVSGEAERAARATARVGARAAPARPGIRPREEPAKAADGAGPSILAAGRGAIGVVAGAVAVRETMRRTVGEAISFDKAMADVRKKVDVPAGMKAEDGFRQIETTIKRLSTELGIPAEKIAALTAEAGASGIAFADLERFMKLTAKASVGWDVSPEEASQSLAEIKAGTGLTIGQLETLADKINALGDNSAAKEKDIVEMFGRSAAAAREAGVDFDTTLAALTAVRAAGMKPEVVSRWFNAFTGGLRTIEDGTAKAKEGLKMLGLNDKTVAAGMQKDPVGTITDLFDRLAKSPDAARAAIKIFGKEWWDETLRAKAAIPELTKQLQLLKDPANYRGSLQKTLNVDLATTANHLARLKALAADVGDRLGRWALPGINTGVERILSLFDEIDRRRKVMEAGEGKPEDKPPPTFMEDPIVWAARKANEVGTMAKDAILDKVIAPKPTDDPNRTSSRQLLQEASDAAAVAKKLRDEADVLDRQAANSKNKPQRRDLQAKAKALRDQSDQLEGSTEVKKRIGGRAAAADMTDVEVGEAAARRSLDETRALRARVSELEAMLASTPNKVVQDPAKGTFMAREVAEGELEGLKAKLRELVGEGEKAAADLKGKLSLDLSAEGSQALASFTAGMKTQEGPAVAAAGAMAAKIRAAFAGAVGGVPISVASIRSTSSPVDTGPVATTPSAAGARPAGSVGAGGSGTAAVAAGPTTVHVGGITVTGSGNPERTADAVATRLAGAIQRATSGALHDGVA